ncbi:MAG: hypothetical protein ACI9G1_004327, partial [Pirellulaceae bacterium]
NKDVESAARMKETFTNSRDDLLIVLKRDVVLKRGERGERRGAEGRRGREKGREKGKGRGRGRIEFAD